MRTAYMTVALMTLLATPVLAQVSDPDMTCAAYLKMADALGPTPKTGDDATDKMSASLDKKINDACKAAPTAKAMDVMQKALSSI
jgi:hypothetical protein